MNQGAIEEKYSRKPIFEWAWWTWPLTASFLALALAVSLASLADLIWKVDFVETLLYAAGILIGLCASATFGMWYNSRQAEEEELRNVPLPQREPDPEPAWRPPVPLIREGNIQGYLNMNEPKALPSPKRQRLELTPDLVTVILQEIFRMGGNWSRERIMNIRFRNRTVPKRLYNELTTTLVEVGILQPRSQGGYFLPFESLGQLQKTLPGLVGPAVQSGRPAETGGLQGNPVPGGVGATSAERHAARYYANQRMQERHAREANR